MSKSSRRERCFAKPVIPVVSDLSCGPAALAPATCVILQGMGIVDLPDLVTAFESGSLKEVCLLVHVDLIAGLENNDAGLEFLAQFPRIDGIVTVHHHLIGAARRLDLFSIARIFLSDSRALERGLKALAKTPPDVVDLLPAAAAVHVADEFKKVRIPRIAGGLCRTADDVRAAIESGCLSVTSTLPLLWQLNSPPQQ